MTISLSGLRVLNTRPVDQAIKLSAEIRALGGEVIECPTLAIQPLPVDCLAKLPDLNIIDYAIFISANAVTHFFASLTAKNMIWPHSVQAIAIGESTATELRQYIEEQVVHPQQADSEHLLALSCLQEPCQKTILLVKGEGGRTLLADALSARGAKLYTVSVYKRVMPIYEQQFINSLWHEDRVDIILITSEQSLRNLFHMFPPEAHVWLCNKKVLVLSKRLADAAASMGMKNIIINAKVIPNSQN